MIFLISRTELRERNLFW